MTRINVVPPEELCDQHLLAEHREMTRIPSVIAKRNGAVVCAAAGSDYCLGTGHVRFFYDRLGYLFDRYEAVHNECLRRGFKVQWRWNKEVNEKVYAHLFKNYSPTPNALRINRERIQVRMPAKARFLGVKQLCR